MNVHDGSAPLQDEPHPDDRHSPPLDADHDRSEQIIETIREASIAHEPLAISGGNNKAFYGRHIVATPLSVGEHTGILSYDPTELVLTARAGTCLALIESVLADHRQVIPFEPPKFGATATLGGAIACGLSGPRRPFAGATRDFVLGVTLVTGQAQRLRFGGQVMKNVAGYDIARLMAGSLGTLGVLLEASIKVLPAPQAEITLVLEHQAEAAAIRTMNALAARPLPLSAACAYEGNLYVRLSGMESAVSAARQRIGGSQVDGTSLWQDIREHTHAFFAGSEPLWRVSVPSAAPVLDLPGHSLIDWAGAQRWLRTNIEAPVIRSTAERLGGHATLFRGHDGRGEVFHPLSPTLLTLHQRLKAAFDPQRILNPGRLYEAL
ncbi:MAG: glycolate oxidase subunit GlcE [Gammaproteobacteria bacterium]